MLKTFILHQRPIKLFDSSLVEHRELYHKFLKTMSWAHCPYQWAIDDDSLDIVHCINKKMLNYYMNVEFVAKKPQKATKTAQKNVFKINDLVSRKKLSK
jgi:hypothetical protein